MTNTLWTRLVAELQSFGEALAALDDDGGAIKEARLRRLEDDLAALQARVAAMQREALRPDAGGA